MGVVYAASRILIPIMAPIASIIVTTSITDFLGISIRRQIQPGARSGICITPAIVMVIVIISAEIVIWLDTQLYYHRQGRCNYHARIVMRRNDDTSIKKKHRDQCGKNYFVHLILLFKHAEY